MPTLPKPPREPRPGCRRCPRLLAHRRNLRRSDPQHHNAPVPARYGDAPRMLLVGLAPGSRGANRTGIAFHGDASSRTLFAGLMRAGLANTAESDRTPDGIGLTNAVRCLPPANRPLASEMEQCQPFLRSELQAFLSAPLAVSEPRVVFALGGIAHRAVETTLNLSRQPFCHGAMRRLGEGRFLVSSYHPSLQNVNTGRLSVETLAEVLTAAGRLAELLAVPSPISEL